MSQYTPNPTTLNHNSRILVYAWTLLITGALKGALKEAFKGALRGIP